MRKRSSLTVAQKTQNIWNFMVGKSSLQKEQLWRSSRRDQTLIWRLGDKVQNLEAPGLSGRDDSTALLWVHTLMCPSPVTLIEKLVNANSYKINFLPAFCSLGEMYFLCVVSNIYSIHVPSGTERWWQMCQKYRDGWTSHLSVWEKWKLKLGKISVIWTTAAIICTPTKS